VDVPGHERFVKNMVAGSTGVDAFLLVVAADDGVMPQTREHLDVLRVLDVRRGVVALTKIDTVDEETVELAQLEVAELLEPVGFEAPIIPVSGVTGEGVDELLLALDELTGRSEKGRVADLARLPVDRAFVLKGIGLVATGTLWSGEIRPGDTLYTAAGRRPRVRGVQNHGRPAQVARTGPGLLWISSGSKPPSSNLETSCSRGLYQLLVLSTAVYGFSKAHLLSSTGPGSGSTTARGPPTPESAFSTGRS
jgi:selenocysteine-specific elongation factor